VSERRERLGDSGRGNEIAAGDELELLDALLDAEGVAAPGASPLRKRAAPSAPLSPAQRRLWFLHQLDPAALAYSVCGAVRLQGPLDVAALQAALTGVVARHEVLRTTFEEDAGEPRQIIQSAMQVPLEKTGGQPGSASEQATRVALDLVRRGWNLERGPLLRAALIELAPRDHACIVALHHIVADGWSIGILLRELGALYDARLAGMPSNLIDLPVQYADYAAWQDSRPEPVEAPLSYWKARLAGSPERLDLPTAGPRRVQSARLGAQERFRLTAEVTESLKGLGRREGATLFMILLAAWQILLSRTTGQDDVLVGTPVAGRDHLELEGLIGFFVNTLVLRADLSGDPTFREFLAQVRRNALDAFAHQDLPFERLVEALQPAREAGVTPLFQVMLSLQNAPEEELRLAGLSVSTLEIDVPTAKFDLTLDLREKGGALEGTLEYDADRFDRGTISRMLGHYRTLLEGIAVHPGARLSELPLLTREERQQLLGWNRTEDDAPLESCVHELFAEQARRTPEAIAVQLEERRLTYGELDRRANQLAHLLRRKGVGPDACVGTFMDRSLELVVGILGIQKAGGAYLPLDPSYPRQRLSFMLDNARAAALLTQSGLLNDLPEQSAPVIALDEDWALLAPESPLAPMGGACPENLAYVLYTSGSTGNPHAVMISHRALANHMRWMSRAFPLDASDTVLQRTSSSFDASVWEFYAPLIAGARLFLAAGGGHQEPACLIDTVQKHAITTLQMVPSLLALLLEDESVSRCTGLKRVFCGGEVLPLELQERFFALLPAELCNLYGPTEATIDATFWRCRREGDRKTVPIGSPIANLRAHVLDSHGQPVPVGVRGELYLAGRGLARGYLGDPALTAERFIPNHLPENPGERLYRTGDAVRRAPDGAIEYLGRIDEQVKVRGFRVEPGEIEAILAEHPAVLKVVVVARADGFSAAGESEGGSLDPSRATPLLRNASRLAAYIVPRTGEPPTAEALRRYLAERLPRFMIPSAFTMLAALPLTPSGKIDRRALPAPEAAPAASGGAFVAPRTAAEELIAGIWSQLLSLQRVGRDDDFFALGGHSLLAMRVVARLRRLLGVELPVRALFDAPTLRAFAARIEGERRSESPCIAPAPPEKRRRLSYAQRRLWFLHRLEPESAAYHVANALRIEGDLDPVALRRALAEIVRRHEALRTRFAEGPEEPFQIVGEPAPIALPVEDLTCLAPAEREREAARRAGLAAREAFDLERGEVVRARLLRLAPREHVLVLVLHHIASDGWSMGLLVGELAAAYAAYARGEAPDLRELPVQYADWAAWQRDWLEGGEMERQLAYWRRELRGLEPLDLPTDRPRRRLSTGVGASLDVRLDADLAGRLTTLARSEGATLHMALLTAFAAVLGRWSGQEDFGIGTPVANRTREEVEPLIGFFVNSLVIRARMAGRRLPYRELLGRIRESALGAYAHQDVPFERVVETLQPQRDLSRTPLFQAMFILQNAPSAALALGGLRLRTFETPTQTSPFELTLSLSPSGGAAQGLAGGALEGFLEYSTELFEAATMRRFWDHFTRLLEIVADRPEADVRAALLPGEGERLKALEEWSGAREVEPGGRLVHERFAARAAEKPERVAAVCGERRVSYGEIDARSDHLAAHLAGLGVGPETRVGLCVERSPELLVGMMAVLKAGGAFVPLDPDHPRDRLECLLEDAGARVVLVTRAGAPLIGSSGRAIVGLDEEWKPAAPPARLPSPESLAYVIYTSGTTGRPKGVMVTHAGLAAAYTAWERLYDLGERDRHLQMAAVSFDVCTGDVVRALCSGGTLVFCERQRLLDPARLFELIRRERIRIADFVPAVLRPLAAYARERGERLDSLRIAIVGSDVWTTAEIEEFQGIFGTATRLANGYGVTEATIDSTCWFVGDGEGVPGSPPIGRPLSHTTVYLLDQQLHPVPPAVIGEIYLGGPALARGYLGRSERTAERFVPNPFGERGARLYRSGDRARYLPDGRIVFAGRADEQVKIRGQRVEPAEVEAALASQAEVGACAVVARRDPEGVLRLAAYVVPRPGAAFETERARLQLREKLPEALIPSALVRLAALPLTAHGKVDRVRLPDPDWHELRAYEEPSTPAEVAVAAAFAEVLQLPRVGAGDDFFALGGHSLLATQVVSRLRASLGVEVPLRMIFEAPTVRGLAAGAAALGARRRTPPRVRPATSRERRRPSYAQQRLWFLDRLEPESPAYNLPSAIRLRGDLDAVALQRSLTEVARRQEALRTRFAEGPEGPEQVIDPPAPVLLATEDLSSLAEEDRRRAAERLTREEARRPFDLARGPLLRARLLRLASREHLLLVTLHHSVADGWSMGVLVREVGVLYGAYASGRESPLEEPVIQYADWAAWQRVWLEGGEMERQLAFWRAELRGAATLVVASDRPRPARPTHAGESLPIRMPAALRDGLARLARQEGATLTMGLLAGYAATLGRWSGQKDFAVGMPVANRRAVEAESLIGFFVNTLAVRARLGGRSLTFRRLIGRMRESALGAFANQDVPFERVVETVQPDRTLGHSPVVQTLFALQNAPAGAIELPGLALEYAEPDTGVTRFDLELFLAETAAGLEGTLNYSTELFDRATMQRFAEGFTAFLEAGLENPDRSLADLPALPPAQLHRLRVEWNAANHPYPDPQAVHVLFERHVALTPEAVAARFGDARLTYGELNARANRLARLLRRRGVGSEDRVAVCVERSFDMLVALAAILKAGAAYVPLDPEYPRERIAFILADARIALALTQAPLADRLAGAGAEAIRLDEDWEAIAREEEGNLGLDVPPDSLVYSVYTSGSTGRPKGVAMSHRAISNLLSFQRRDSEAAGALRTLQFASLSFDVSFQEIFSTLTAGGEIVLVGEEERRDPSRLLRRIAAGRVERLFVPFVALNQLAETAQEENLHPPSLREINTAGEQLRITPAIRDFFARLSSCRLVNHYGPSETHLVTTFELEGNPGGWPELPSIGRPIPNAPVFLLDADARPVPAGVPGELCVGGAGLARGYHGRPDRTAERFVPDPFSAEPGARLYRTGDVARFRAGGTLEFLGRRDLQVKVRGYRVEPGEIEAALSRHPAVRQAVVTPHDHRGGKRLAAYVVPHGGARVTPSELKEHLARALPEFMVPAAVVLLEALPLTPNGKVDRQALPEPEWSAAAGYVAPRSPQEEVVCNVFAEVLGLPRAGAADNFFDLGGHSLLATQVIARVRRAFGVEVPLRALFEAPTPAGVAAAAARHAGSPVPPPIRPADPAGRRALSFAQRRLWFLHQLEPESSVYNLPTAVRLEGDLDVSALGRALAEIVRRHEALRTRFVEGAAGPEQVIDAPFELRLEPENLSGAAGQVLEEARRLLAAEAARPFDLARGPVMRLRLLRLNPRDHLLSLGVHHIAADGWSVGVLVRELGRLYEAYAAGGESPLEEPVIQYADWAAWQRAWLEQGELDRQMAYWRSELEGAPGALELPTDRARPATATWNGAAFDLVLPAGLRARLGELARSEGATLHMALLAGYAWTLMRHAGQEEIVVGTPVANRRAAEAEGLVGFFVNTLAVRVRAGGESLTYRGLLARVREASLKAYANQDVPFERVVEELQPERSLNRAPLFQTAFALQNARLPELALGDVRMTPFEIESTTAKFDLMLVLEEAGEGLAGAFEYNTDLFDQATVETIAVRLEKLLQAAAAAPDTALSALPFLDEAAGDEGSEAAFLAVERRSGESLLHELFERQVSRTPEAPALAVARETLSYVQLEARANRLAGRLQALGVGPERRVAILLERSIEAIVGLLAVLKAGGAYVPLDPLQPEARLRWLVENSGAAFVLAEPRLAEAIGGTGAPLIVPDRAAAAAGEAPVAPPRQSARPANLAYVIYTSGSTGRPKGVAVEHRQIVSYVLAAIERLELRPGWQFALVSTLAADLGYTSLFPSLATGGCLHLLPPDLSFDAAGVEAYFDEHRADCLKIVPSHLQALLAGSRPERVLPRRLLVLGGEATPGARLSRLRELAPECRVANHYGPTETTVGAVAGFPEAGDAARSGLPMGRPLANARAYLLDGRQRRVPAGVPGELFLGGAGVARGYLDAPDLTAERFLPDPFSPVPGARLYRSGDRARRLRDGRLEFLGRADGQVKVRGYRIEPREIEIALKRHPDVREAAVVARPDPASGARLNAYVVPEPRASRTLHGLPRRRLPNGMAVAEFNRNETDYIYREIFDLQAYARHGITLRAGDTIVDVGANIGLFTLFAGLACERARLFALEPNPHLQAILRANLARLAPGATILDVGLSDRERNAPFTFFPGFSLLSGLYADAAAERQVVKSYLENQGRTGAADAARLAQEADALLAERFAGRTFEVRLRALSDVMAEHRIERIGLLKINAEKAELEVLRGIEEADWPRIDQAVIEVDREAHLGPAVALLEEHDFQVLVDQDPLLERTELRYVYAARRGSGRVLVADAGPPLALPTFSESFLTPEDLRAHLRGWLPDAMQPAAWVFLEALPLTANGKLDRARLPEPVVQGSAYRAPRGGLQRAIAGIWSEVLGIARVGAQDNFFDLGGHSLLLARVHARLREVLKAEISIVELFRFPTVAALATRLAGNDVRLDVAQAGRQRGARRRAAARTRVERSRAATPGADA
jgi:amino acid adenylation domain-containing protein/FkbM family methyltransferase